MPEVRENKVAELKAQIESGTYQVSNRAIARAMVGTLLSEMA
jgi:negative regulator of flagellin synthesis FlgM